MLIGSLATCASLYSIAGLIHAGVNSWFDHHRSSVTDTFRGTGVRDPGGSAAFSVVLPVAVAALCWWGVISDWKQSRAGKPIRKIEEPNKPAQTDGDKPPS